MFPEARNQILIRVENIADLFDSSYGETSYFDIHSYASNLYVEVNDGELPQAMSVTERTLGNNQDWSDWQLKKLQWLSESTGVPATQPTDNDE